MLFSAHCRIAKLKIILRMRYKWFASYTKSGKVPNTKAEYETSYYDWIEHIKLNVPKEKLLIFKPSNGWKPLCDFLNVSGLTHPQLYSLVT